jgi:hypothetical protein
MSDSIDRCIAKIEKLLKELNREAMNLLRQVIKKDNDTDN